jgi:CRISPR-associated exonuclease Cas4
MQIIFTESDLLPLSALQHLLFCPRQCALIHLERLWAENSLTLEGQHLHAKADSGKAQARNGLRSVRSLPLRSLQLGLIGKADVVEFHSPPGGGGDGRGEVPFPVEYKRGQPKKDGSDLVQLCAQALCLEEMLGTAVPAGAIFYGRTRRRLEVAFDAPLRQLTLQTIERLHELIASGRTPLAKRQKKCERCSLRFLCLPDVLEGSESASRYLGRSMALCLSGAGPAGDDP